MSEVNTVFDDFELRRLLLTEFEAIRTNKSKLPLALKQFYLTLGGNAANAKAIYLRVVELYAMKKLEKVDFPGPDTLWKPKIREFIVKFVGESFDDVFRE
jgi:hypothetical protein